MALNQTFKVLQGRLHKLHDAMLNLTLTLTEDRPLQNDLAVTQHWADAAENTRGLVQEALDLACEAYKLTGPPPDLERLRLLLAACHGKHNQTTETWLTDVASCERIQELSADLQQRSREWKEWIRGSRIAVERCNQPLADTAQALLDCWQDLAERAHGASVTVCTSHIDRQINFSPAASGTDR